jgi:phospholipid/cholesterol/gamma-HCH transport system substrate-binding protein
MIGRRRQRTGRLSRTPDGLDERIYGHHYRGPRPWLIGLVIAALAAALGYLAFFKEVPWAGQGYQLKATFENAATLRTTAPVRIAGVDVGEVTSFELRGDAAEVTFTVEDQGRPIHEDAEVRIRPRLFLEGNFFLDLSPGSPSAPELPDGGEIPVTRTSTAVQLDEVLTALKRDSRRDLQRLLAGYGTALNYEPTAADDAGQDPDVAGQTAGESLNDALRHGGRAGRDTAIVAEALRGERPRDLSQLVVAQRDTFGKLETVEGELQDLVTNLNVTTGALAAESENLSRTIGELAPTLERATPSLRELSDSLPPLRALAIEARPGIAELPGTIDAFRPWLDQIDAALAERELGGLARRLARAAPGLAQTARFSRPLFHELRLLGRCASDVLIPAGDVVVDSEFRSGQPNYREFFHAAVQIAGESQSFDGNGHYVRFQAGGGPVMVEAPNPGGFPENTKLFGHTIEAPRGIQPALPSERPPFRMDFPCHRNPVPDINGPAGAVTPPDLVEVSP